MHMLGAFVVGFFASLLGSAATGANLISVPGLIFLGVPPITAIATTRLSAAVGGSVVAYRYSQAKMIRWRYVPIFAGIAVLAGILGPEALLYMHSDSIEPVIGVLLLASLPLMFFKRKFGEKRRRTSRTHKLLGLAALLIIMSYGTAFSVGGGVFMIYALVYFFGMNLMESNATGLVVWVLSAATALVTYISKGDVDFALGIPMVIGSVIGGSIGVRLAIKNGVHWVKYVTAAVIVVSGIKLLFF